MKLEHIKEGEFKRLAQLGSFEAVLAQESSETENKFHLIGVNFTQQVQYVVRAGRTDTLRAWRMDHLTLLVKSLGVTRMEVRFSEKADIH
ncbi:hypothetical protein [Vibrio sp. TBV020]|uniref:hypothetical protein n=1 Tax=Vibrio sp. TBV020 TaxID=3137398 RepID=UPI0038CD9EEF